MTTPSLQRHRAGLKRNGMRRVEVCVHDRDVQIIRSAARILATDAGDAADLRALIADLQPKRPSFREWMATP